MQDRIGPDWDDVRVFLAAFRDGSLGVAAGHLGVDVSTVSRRLGAFEQALGARLFDRTRQGLVRLEAAEALLPAAEAMEAAHGRLTRDASATRAEAKGVVRLSIAPGMADVFIAPALPALRSRYPHITLELDASTRVVDLTRHAADLALRSVAPEGADLIVTKLTRARWVAVGGKRFAKNVGRLKRWDEVPWIAWDRDLSSLPAARWLSQHVPGADVALRTSHFASQVAAAEAGLGAALVPVPYVKKRKLVELQFVPALALSAAAWPEDDLWLVGHRALREVPRVDAVWNFLKSLPWDHPVGSRAAK